MKKIAAGLWVGLAFCLMAPSGRAANTDGTVSFSVTTVNYTAPYSPRNVAVVWVVDSSNRFVKTLCRHAATRIQYLSRWSASRGSYTNVDGTTSATLTTQPQTHTVTWNCRDTNNAVVPDGVYTFKVEYTSANGDGPYTTSGMSFTKGTTGVVSNYPNYNSAGGSFTGMSLTYTPILSDVAVTSLSPSAGNVNTTIPVVVGVSNRTATATPAFTVILSNITAVATLIGTQTVATLAGNAATNVTISWNTTGLSPGAYLLQAHIPALAGETNLANNILTNTLTLESALHDIAVTGIGISAVVPPDVMTNVTVAVTNAGGFTESFTLALSNLTTATLIGSRSITGLAAGAFSNVVFSWNTAGAAIGIHVLQASAAPVAGEIQADNNIRTQPVIVAHGLETNTLVARGAEWKYLYDGLDISGAPWTQPAANYYDGFWPAGPAPLGFGAPGLATALGTAPPAPVTLASDNAAAAAYDSGWPNGSNAGEGFGAWQLTASGTGGHFMGPSAQNAGGASGGIDTGGRAWGLWASTGTTEAVRPLTGGGLTTGQVLRLAFDNGWIANDRSAGIAIRNAAGQALWEFYFYGGTNNYYIQDGAGIQYSTIPFTGDGLQIAFERTGPTSYVAQVHGGSGTYDFSGATMTQADPVPAQIRCWNYQAGSSSNADVFLNSLSVATGSIAGGPSVVSPITAYFRKEFTMDFPPIAVSGVVRREDGIVLYLNGQEIDRQNMPSGKIVAATPASSNLTGTAATNYSAFAIAPNQLVPGRNWLAAEVHLYAPTATSLAFDLELTAINDAVAKTMAVAPTGIQALGTVQSGDMMNITVALANTGNVATACTLVIRDAATGAILASRDVPVLVAGEVTTVQVSWPTLGLASGTTMLQALTVINGVTNLTAVVSNKATISALDFAPRQVEASGSVGGFCRAVAASGQTVYLGMGSTLEIWNAANLANPVKVGAIRLPGLIEDLTVGGSAVYAAAGAFGVHVVDVSMPSTPQHVATYDTSGNSHRLAFSGTTLYIADGRGGVRRLNVANPSAPGLSGAYATAGAARALYLEGATLTVLDTDNGLQMLTTDALPTLLGAERLLTGGLGLAGISGTAFATDANGYLYRIATTNPAAPAIAARVLLPAPAATLVVSGPALYIAAGPAGLLTADAATLAVVATNALGSEAVDVALSGSTLFVAAGFGGCQVLDVSSPLAPAWLGAFGNAIRSVDAAAVADALYVAGDEAGLQVHQLDYPARPVWKSTLAGATSPRSLVVAAGVAYVGEATGGLNIYSLADPLAPLWLGSAPAHGLITLRRIALSDTRLAATDGRQINLLDVANPAAPALIASNAPPGYVFDLAATPTHFYAACGGGGLRILDSSTLGLVGNYSTMPDPVTTVAVQPPHAYIGNGRGTFRTLDISNPSAPSPVQTVASPGFGIAAAGSLLYGVDGLRHGSATEVADPLTPVSALNLANLTFGLRVQAHGGLVLVAEDEAGLALFNASPDDINLNGIPDDVDQQIADADANDSLQTIWDVLSGDDFDGDGLSNLAESLAGTSPVDPASFFAISAGVPQADGGTSQFVVRWYSVPEKTYTIHKSTNLMTGFTTLQAGIPADVPVNSYTDTVSAVTTYYMISVP